MFYGRDGCGCVFDMLYSQRSIHISSAKCIGLHLAECLLFYLHYSAPFVVFMLRNAWDLLVECGLFGLCFLGFFSFGCFFFFLALKLGDAVGGEDVVP